MSEEFEDHFEDAIESWNNGLLDVQLPTNCYYQLRHIIAEISCRPDTEVKNIEGDEFIVAVINYDDECDNGSELSIEFSDEVDIDTWKKFHDVFCFPFVERCQNLVQKIEVELAELKSNITNLRQTAAFFRNGLDDMLNFSRPNSLEMELLIQNNIQNLENRASEIQMAFVEMERTRNIFPEFEDESPDAISWWIPLPRNQ